MHIETTSAVEPAGDDQGGRRKMELPSLLSQLKSRGDKWGEWEGPIPITQMRISLFAGATGDQQKIHTDSAWAKDNVKGGQTIAHGMLVAYSALASHPVYMEMCGENCGVTTVLKRFDSISFDEFVFVGSEIVSRMRVTRAMVGTKWSILHGECQWALRGNEEKPVGSASFTLFCTPRVLVQSAPADYT